MHKDDIKYPYMPEGRTIKYVSADNPFMIEAKAYAKENSLDEVMPNASLLVKDSIVIGRAANGSDYHKHNECERIKRNIPTGQGYELCEGCHPKNHSESKAIKDALGQNHDPEGADLYLWGHWWCCEPCWNAIIEAGVRDVYLLDGSGILFNKSAEGNIVGHQFD